MFRDNRDAVAEKLTDLEQEAERLRRENEAMRHDLLLVRGSPQGIVPAYQQSPAALSPGERAALGHHTLTAFPVWATAVLHLMTFGLFSMIHFSLLHDKLPRAQHDDPTSGRAIGFSFVPYYNFYWIVFNTLRLTDRLNLQFRLRGQADGISRQLMMACGIIGVIPYLNILLGLPILWLVGVVHLQQAVNRLAAMGPAGAAHPYAPWAPALPGAQYGAQPGALAPPQHFPPPGPEVWPPR